MRMLLIKPGIQCMIRKVIDGARLILAFTHHLAQNGDNFRQK